MEILIDNDLNYEDFCDVFVGGIFSCHNHVYMKVDCPNSQYNCVRLDNGKMYHVNDDTIVIVANGESLLHVKF